MLVTECKVSFISLLYGSLFMNLFCGSLFNTYMYLLDVGARMSSLFYGSLVSVSFMGLLFGSLFNTYTSLFDVADGM